MAIQINYQIIDQLIKRGSVREEAEPILIKYLEEETEPGPNTFLVSLIKKFSVKDTDLRNIISALYKLPKIELGRVEPSREALRLLSHSVCNKFLVVPFKLEHDTVHIATFNPGNLEADDVIQALTGRRPVNFVCSYSEITDAISEHFRIEQSFANFLEEEALDQSGIEPVLKQAENNEYFKPDPASEVSRLIQKLIKKAIRSKASTIQFEARESEMSVRLIIDGDSYEIVSLPQRFKKVVPSHLLALAGIIVSDVESLKHRNVKIQIGGKGEFTDARISHFTMGRQERWVVRLPEIGVWKKSLFELGFSKSTLTKYLHAIVKKPGLVLVTSPAGTGKTTTLYATVRHLHEKRSPTIVSVEQYFEYLLEEINQFIVNESKGNSYPKLIRSLIDDKPDFMMIDSLRDKETVEQAFVAISQGISVIAGFECEAPSHAIPLLLRMGFSKQTIASNVRGVLGQRLVKRICPNCIRDFEPSQKEYNLLESLGRTDLKQVRAGIGCENCRQTGYFGRTGVFEFMPVSESMRKVVLSSPDPQAIQSIALQEGMKTSTHYAYLKALKGLTTLSEAFNAVGPFISSHIATADNTVIIDVDNPNNNETAAIETVKPDKLGSSPVEIVPVAQRPLERDQLVRGPAEEVALVREENHEVEEEGNMFERVEEVGGSDPMIDLGAPNPSYPEFPLPGAYGVGQEEEEPLIDLEPLEEDFNNQSPYDGVPLPIMDDDNYQSGQIEVLSEVPADQMYRVLTCDDDPSVRAAMKQILESTGMFEVHEAADGSEGLHKVFKLQPDLFILELGVPNLSGFQLLEMIRNNQELENMLVVIVTGDPEESDEVAAFSIGADEYLRKPVSPDIFLARVNRLFKRTGGGFR